MIALLVAGGLAAIGWLVYEFASAPVHRDPVADAYDTLPAGRPELHIDTTTGSHDRYPHMSENTRDITLAYLESMWAYSKEQSR